jgi:hypothetical protein
MALLVTRLQLDRINVSITNVFLSSLVIYLPLELWIALHVALSTPLLVLRCCFFRLLVLKRSVRV